MPNDSPHASLDDSPLDSPPDDASDHRWLSIAELARSRRITKHSAWRLVTRRQWRRLKGNDGTTRIYVPAGQELPQVGPPDDAPDDVPDIPNDVPNDTNAIVSAKDEVIAGHLAHIGTLKETLAKSEAKVVQLEARVATAETESDRLRDELHQWRSAGWWRRRRLRRSWRGRGG